MVPFKGEMGVYRDKISVKLGYICDGGISSQETNGLSSGS